MCENCHCPRMIVRNRTWPQEILPCVGYTNPEHMALFRLQNSTRLWSENIATVVSVLRVVSKQNYLMNDDCRAGGFGVVALLDNCAGCQDSYCLARTHPIPTMRHRAVQKKNFCSLRQITSHTAPSGSQTSSKCLS